MATNVKKIFLPLIALLEANSGKSVKAILPEVLELAASKGAGGVATASHKVDGQVVAVRCSFFEKWFPVSHVPFGNKEGSATGLNPMCKEGANLFSLMQREYKKGKEAILDKVASGDLAPEKIESELKKLEKARTDRPEYSVEGMGWDTLEECLAQKPATLDKLVKDHNAKVEAKAKADAEAAAAKEAKDKAAADKAAAGGAKAAGNKAAVK
jgi:hypothetical protein